MSTLESINESEDQNWSYDVSPNGTFHHTSSYTVLKSSRLKLVSGGTTPNFHQAIKNGQFLPYQPWLHTEKLESTKLGSWDFTYTNGLVHIDGQRGYYGMNYEIDEGELLPAVDFTSLLQESVSRAYAQGYDALTAISEFHKVVAMFKRFVPNLARVMREIYKGKLNGDDVASLWLEGRYGWRTLIFDMRDIQNTIENFDAERRFYSERTGSSYSDSGTQTTIVYSSGGLTCTEDITTSVDYSYRGACSLELSPAKYSFNPFVTAYELMTLSFVLDWFYDVGRSLSAYSANVIAANVTAAVGKRITITRNCSQSWSYGTGIESGGTSSAVTAKSSLITTSRVPTEVDYSPQWQFQLNPFKFLDLLALFQKLLK